MADVSERGFVKGAQWLVWRFESDATLADAMQVGPTSLPQHEQAGAAQLCWAVLSTAPGQPCLQGDMTMRKPAAPLSAQMI